MKPSMFIEKKVEKDSVVDIGTITQEMEEDKIDGKLDNEKEIHMSP